jgi:hypothetical protein
MMLPVSASQAARITVVNLWYLAEGDIFCEEK